MAQYSVTPYEKAQSVHFLEANLQKLGKEGVKWYGYTYSVQDALSLAAPFQHIHSLTHWTPGATEHGQYWFRKLSIGFLPFTWGQFYRKCFNQGISLLPAWHKATTWTNTDLLSLTHWGHIIHIISTLFFFSISNIFVHKNAFEDVCVKWWPFCSVPNVLTHLPLDKMAAILILIFLNENGEIQIQISLKFVSRNPVSIGSINDLAPKRQQAITRTNDDPVHRQICHTRGRWVEYQSLKCLQKFYQKKSALSPKGQWVNSLRPRQMAAFSQTTLSNAFSWMKILEFRLKNHWSLFLRVLLTIFQHWFW